jgi:hypothetical protein
MSGYVRDEYDVMNLVFWVQRLGKRVHKYEPESEMVRKAYEFLDRRNMRSPTDVLREHGPDPRDEQIRVLREALMLANSLGGDACGCLGRTLRDQGLCDTHRVIQDALAAVKEK